jgi:hypothetical protein
LNRETKFDRWAKRALLAHELQTGDQEFDDFVYVRAPVADYSERLLADRRKRAAVRLLLGAGFERVAYERDRIVATWTRFNPEKDDRPQLVEDASQWLHALGLELPDFVAPEAEPSWDWRKLVHRGLWVVQIAFAATVICTFMYPPIRTRELLVPTLMTWVMTTAVFGILAGVLLRGTSTSHDLWAQLMWVGVFLAAAGSLGSVAGINGAGDATPPKKVTATVIDKRISRGRRNSKTYYAEIPAWDRPGDTLEFRVPFVDYNRIVPHQSQLVLIVREGRLGIAWLESTRVIP